MQACEENTSQPSCLVFLGLRGYPCMFGEKGEDTCGNPMNGPGVGVSWLPWGSSHLGLPLAYCVTPDKAAHRPGPAL